MKSLMPAGLMAGKRQNNCGRTSVRNRRRFWSGTADALSGAWADSGSVNGWCLLPQHGLSFQPAGYPGRNLSLVVSYFKFVRQSSEGGDSRVFFQVSIRPEGCTRIRK